MSYTCEKCAKQFTKKSLYERHLLRKTSCLIELVVEVEEVIKVDKVVTEKEITKVGTLNIKCVILKPILKWVGGKTQILDKLFVDFPTRINNYHEIFVGGGSVLLTLLSYVNAGIITINGKIYAYDVNEPLIYVYRNIQTSVHLLYEQLQVLIHQYNECTGNDINRKPETLLDAKKSKENYYYWIRIQYNKLSDLQKKSVIGSAMFIFLNKTCFRGVFRVGPNGFNVPFGHYTNPEIINKEHLESVHTLIQNVVFECMDFEQSLTTIDKNVDLEINKNLENDFIYLDPPYAPETATSFVGYTDKGFTLEQHKQLFQLCNSLTFDSKKKIMMSNADVSLVREHFNTSEYSVKSILCKRSINSKNPDAKAKEVIITNY